MEQKIDELLKQLHKFLFADSDQIVNELRLYLIDSSLKEADLAFCSSKIFNSKVSILEFLRQNALQNERLLSSVKKRLYELMIEFIKFRQHQASPYLATIKETCLLSFRSDSNSLVKEASLHLLLYIIEEFNHVEIEGIIKPRDLMVMLLDEIKLRRPSASVKGTIWTMVGLLHEKYGLEEFRVESQDVMYIQLLDQMKSEKPEIKCIVGLLKGLTHSLAQECTLDEEQVDSLFVCLKTAIQPIEDMSHKGVMKAGMKLLGTHINLFNKHITKHAIEFVTLTLKLCINENMEVRDTANEMLGKIMQQISDGLTQGHNVHKDIFKNIISKFQEILEDSNHANILLISTIKAVGIFSKAIQTFMGDDQLWKYLERLVELSEIKLIKEFEEQEDPSNNFHNFKQILKKQKQLISFIESYSYIVQNLQKPPSEDILLHFYKICSIGVRHHRKLYPKYRTKFYDALAFFTMSLSQHKSAFIQWSKKFIKSALLDTLKIPDQVIFGGESPFDSLQDAVQFWRDWLSKDKIWTEFVCSHIYDELMQRVLEDIDSLNLSYKVEKGRAFKEAENQQILNQQVSGIEKDYVVQYIANNNNDQQYLVRLSNFLEMFLIQCKDEWFLRWVPSYTTTIVKKASQTPRVSKLYALLKTGMQICNKFKYFEVKEDSLKGEKLNIYNMLITYFKELVGKQEEYQDELLTTCLDLLLHVPISILYRQDKRTDNIQLWKGVMLKALEIGHMNSSLAMKSIDMLELWFNALPISVTVELYRDTLPKLSDFLHVETAKKQKVQSETYFYQEMLKAGTDVKVDRKDIAYKVLDLLGKIGGHAHNIINNEQTKQIEKENFIKWDPEKRIKFTLPLYTKKIDIYLDSCLPKLIDLAQNSTDRDTRIAACEFLHALIILMIGKNAMQPKGRKKGEVIEDNAPFAKIYAKLFPVIIKLATEIELISRQLFEPLVFQIVRWFSSSRVQDHPEIESLLDSLIEGAASRNNSALRELCSNAVAEFATWSLKQMSDKDIAENPVNIKSLIRRIESNSNHPDPFKRLSSVLCFNKIFSVIREHDPLIDRFCLEIAHCVLSSLKMCHNSFEFSQEVIENCKKLLEKIQKVIIKKSALLMQTNHKRSIHPNLFVFITFIFEKFTAVEKVYRKESMKLWEALIRSLPPKNADKMPDNPKAWICEYYIQKRGEKSIFQRLQTISFEEKKVNQNDKGKNDFDKKQVISERQKQLDMLTAQLECFEFLLSKKCFTYQELAANIVDEKILNANLRSFIYENLFEKFKKNQGKSLEKLLVCKEDKESITKSKIQLITQLFAFLNALDAKSLHIQLSKIESKASFKIIDLALQIILIPMIHQLQILVEDQELERNLRSQCEQFIKNQIKQISLLEVLKDRIIPQIQIVDLDRIKPNNVQQYNPKMLMQMCLGYLKLAFIDEAVKDFLIQKKHFTSVIEEWLQGESPLENECSRILVKFISKLVIPNETLSEWLTSKFVIYQKTNDLLLQYIAENWCSDKLQVGEYLITKAGKDPQLLGVFIPILEIVSKKAPFYEGVLIKCIPREWQKPQDLYQNAVTQIKIYSFIAVNSKVKLSDKSNKDVGAFIDHLCEVVRYYSREMFSPHLKRDVLYLVGLIYNLHTARGVPVHERVNDSLIQLQNHHFPIKTRELKKNSNEAHNFHAIIDGFLNLLVLSKNLRVLRLLYKCIREQKTTFEKNLKKTLNIVITQSINKMPLAQFMDTLQGFIDEFLNRGTDVQIDDNLRWAIMKKIVLKILETCSLEYLAQFMIKYTRTFVDSLDDESFQKQAKDSEESGKDFYLKVREDTYILKCFEIMFRRLKSETIKEQVHKKVYGAQSVGNELSKALILICNQAKKNQIEGFIAAVVGNSKIETKLPTLNSPSTVQRLYSCAAYSCLTSIVMTTQSKENVFSQFLFITQRDKGDQSIWQLLIDQESAFNFEVETNFNYIRLKNIEKKLEEQNSDVAEIRANNLINDYVTNSFMSANEKFNSAMVFETQLDQINVKSEEEKIQRLINMKLQEGEQQNAEGDQEKKSEEEEKLELDNVNKHPCMKNIKMVIDKMADLFGKQWEQDVNTMPLFMQALNAEIKRPETHINVKIFILKIVINNPNLFAPYAKEWFEPIANYIIEKNNGGKGFHYFMRDLCTLLLSWQHFTPEDSSKNKILCTSIVNTLVKYGADKTKMIFNTNIQIIATMLHRWRKLIALNKDMLTNMIGMPDTKEGSQLWKMTGIQILALAVSFDIPILEKPETITQLSQNQKQFKLVELQEQSAGDKILNALLKIMESKKKQIIYAACETLGKILSKQPSLCKQVAIALFTNENKERHDVFVHTVERVSRDYPDLLHERKIFMKLLSFVNVLTGSMRSSIFKAFERYLHVCKAKKLIDDIKEIAMSILAISDDILADISDENQQSFLQLLFALSKLNIDAGEQLIEQVLPRLKQLFVSNKNEYSRGLFYDLMVYLYDTYENFRSKVKSSLIRGLSDQTKLIRDKLIGFWSDQSRLGLDPVVRLQQIMAQLYVEEEEHIWLNNSVYLLLQISTQSSDYDRLIYDQPLQNCKFQPLEINQFGGNLNRSQPLTPLLSQMDSLFQGSQNAAMHEKLLPVIQEQVDEEMKDSLEELKESEQKKRPSKIIPKAQKKQVQESQDVLIDSSQALQGGFIRATQVPIFTQTYSEQSSLIATNFINSPPSDSFSASFYEINKVNKQSKKPAGLTILKVGASPPEDLGEDKDLFIMPQAKKHKGKQDLRNFMHQNQYVYKPIEENSQRIRYVPQGTMPLHLAKQEERRKMQREQFYNRQMQRMKKQVGLFRKYRVGELPDIQITYKDVLLPLMAIIKNDQTIATEIFVEVFGEIYRGLDQQDERQALGDGIKNIMNKSVQFDYGAINCMHRVSMELLKIDGFTVNADIIQRTGNHSMSYQSSIILLEETIIHGTTLDEEEFQRASQQKGKKLKGVQKQSQKHLINTDLCKINESNKLFWFNLINLYEQIGNDDALQGIWCLLGEEEGVLFNQKEEMSQQQGKALNLIKESHVLRSKGNVSEGLRMLEEALNDPEIYKEFDNQIQLELQNQRLDAKIELQKWDEIAKELSGTYHSTQLASIPFQQAEKLIKSQIRVDQYWEELSKNVELWSNDQYSKQILDKNFNYEYALITLTAKDYDRARFYLDREINELFNQWKNLTKLSQVAQHILVQKMQKIYEMKEFLNSVKSEGILSKQDIIVSAQNQIKNWMVRMPSYAFDKLIIWDDILTSRNMYLDLYNFRLKEDFEKQNAGSRDLNDIRAILQVQCAKGAFKMGLYDTCDRYLKKALKLRKSDDSSNMKIVGPIIKLKSQQFKNDSLNLNFKQKGEKLKKIIDVLESKMKEQNQNQNQRDDLKTEIKSLLIRQNLEQKMLNIMLDGTKESQSKEEILRVDKGVQEYLTKNFTTLSKVLDIVKAAAQYDDHMKQQLSKTYFKYAQFTDKVLRKIENQDYQQTLKKGLDNIQKSESVLARETIKYGLLSLNLEYSKASDIIPRLLDVVTKYKDQVEGDFIAHSKDTPAWFFLRWINQIVALVNRTESTVLEEKVYQIAKKYPQALYYPFKVIESNILVNILDSDIQTTSLFKKLQSYYSKYYNSLNSWIEALDCLIFPEHRFKYWYQIIADMMGEEKQMQVVKQSKLVELTRFMLEDIASYERVLIGDKIGSYNRKFSEKWGKQLIKIFGENAKAVERMDQKKYLQVLQQINQKMNEQMGSLGQGYDKLSTYSEWLDSLDCNDFHNQYEYIELPGQYEGLTSEPIIEKNIKLASIRKTILTLGSIRRPKRITVHGSNEKDYDLLVKGGEDLRLDQRVQQLFQIMNGIFKEDSYCQNRDLYIKTFKVVPITNRLGTLEWVNNTEPMKSIINREHMRIEKGKDLNASRALAQRRAWLKTVRGNEKKESIAEQHLALLMCDEKVVVEGFNKHKDAMPWYLLRNGLENICLNSSAFLTIKNQFIKSLATFSIASYLIGIGDRHLENFLIDTSDGEILGIDFGIAFGSGYHLGIPELIPFRLTQQIEGVISPHPLEGVYKQTMVHALSALRRRKSLILDTCEIFVKEPLLDWVKDAKQKGKAGDNNNNMDNGIGSLMSEYEEELQEISWYPREKIEIVKEKLVGVNPARIAIRELKKSKHEKRVYIKTILKSMEGGEESQRHQLLKSKKKYLDVDEQVDCLIETARDPNILGRTWIGWSPYI